MAFALRMGWLVIFPGEVHAGRLQVWTNVKDSASARMRYIARRYRAYFVQLGPYIAILVLGIHRNKMAGSENTTCQATPMPLSVTGSDHDTMAIVSLVGLVLTVIISLILVFMHLLRYSAPKEQRQIIRIAFTPVVMAIVAFVTFLSYDVAQYIQPVIDLYDSSALASLFLLYVQFGVPAGTFGQELFESMAKSASLEGQQHAWAKVCSSESGMVFISAITGAVACVQKLNSGRLNGFLRFNLQWSSRSCSLSLT